jgi:hypothetical protein
MPPVVNIVPKTRAAYLSGMQPKTYLWGHPWRLVFILIFLLVGGVVASSPVWVGLLGMHLQEVSTGVQANEGNSAWGVLPWLGMATLPIYALAVALTVKVCVILLAIDLFRTFQSRKS